MIKILKGLLEMDGWMDGWMDGGSISRFKDCLEQLKKRAVLINCFWVRAFKMNYMALGI